MTDETSWMKLLLQRLDINILPLNYLFTCVASNRKKKIVAGRTIYILITHEELCSLQWFQAMTTSEASRMPFCIEGYQDTVSDDFAARSAANSKKLMVVLLTI